MDKKILLSNITKIHTTLLGVKRIKNNLKLNTNNVVDYCNSMIMNSRCKVYRKGKNYYCEIDNIIIVINASSYTIITAHTKKPEN